MRIRILSGCILAALSLSTTAQASKIIRRKPEGIIRKSSVVVLVKIVKEKTRREKCSFTRIFSLKVVSSVRGKYRRPRKLALIDYYVTNFTSMGRNGCPMVSFFMQPRAPGLKQGADVLGALVSAKRNKRYSVIGTFSTTKTQWIKKVK